MGVILVSTQLAEDYSEDSVNCFPIKCSEGQLTLLECEPLLLSGRGTRHVHVSKATLDLPAEPHTQLNHQRVIPVDALWSTAPQPSPA